MMMLAALLVVGAFAGSAIGNDALGGYLPPIHEPCVPRQEKIYQTLIITKQVDQPIQVDTTRTAIAQAVATQTMAVTSFMVQTETRQVRVPVTRTFEVTATSIRTVFSTNVVQAPPQVNVITKTQLLTSTQLNQVTQTQFETQIRPIQIISSAFSTFFETQQRVQNVQRTSFITQPAIVSTVFRTQQEVRTQTTRLQDFVSAVTSVQVQTSQAVRFFTPRPIIITNTQRQTRLNTQVQQVLRTQQAIRTAVNTRQQIVQQTSVQIQTLTSTVVREREQTSIQVVNSVVVQTRVVPQYITRTSIVNRVNQQFVTRTQTAFITDTQTVRGRDQYITQVVTRRQNQVQFVTQTINNPQVSTVERVITAPCNQQTGYNYNRPSNPLRF